MTLRDLAAAWNRFFFEPQSPVPIAVYRILYGLLTIGNLIYLKPDWLNWFGAHGWVSIDTMHAMEPGARLNLFTLLPQTDAWVSGVFWLYLFAALLLTLGLFTRASSIAVFILAASVQQRNIYILHAGDSLMRLTAFFLMFSSCGAAISIDRLIRIVRGKEGIDVPLKSPWAQRMIQFQVMLVYLTGFWWKSMGVDWVNGTALYYVMHVAEMRRFPLLPAFYSPILLKLGTWFTLIFELGFSLFVWFRETRYVVLLIGLMFHLIIEYTLNIQLFEWMMVVTYVLFLDPDDLRRARGWLHRLARSS